MSEKLVSVLMSTYNETIHELDASIGSILKQDYPYYELVIVNDNPTNAQLNNYLDSINDKRVRIIKNSNNIGLVKSLNKALKHCNGDLIMRMDADDVCEKHRMSKQVKCMMQMNADLIGSNIYIINEQDEQIGEMIFPSTHRWISFFMKWGSCIPHPTWMVKKSVYDKLNGYRDCPRCEDYDFLVRAIAMGYKFYNVPEKLLYYRIRNNSVSKSGAIEQYVLRNYISKDIKHILSEEVIYSFIHSNEFRSMCAEYEKLIADKKSIKQQASIKNLSSIVKNSYFITVAVEKIMTNLRKSQFFQDHNLC